MRNKNDKMMWKLFIITMFVIIYPALCYADSLECNNCVKEISGMSSDGVSECTHWTCELFGVFFDTGNYLAYITSLKMTKIGLKILGVGLGIWLVFYFMPIVASFKASNPGQVFTKMGATFLKAIVVAAFLSAGIGSIYQYFITPITAFSAGVSEKIMNASGLNSAKFNGYPNLDNSVLDGEVKSDLMHIVSNTVKALETGMDFASLLMCEAKRPQKITVAFIPIPISIPNIPRWLMGGLIWLIFGVMMILFPFYLIDALFKVLFICMFLPLFMVAWVFPATKEYATKAFNIILGGFMTFVFMGLVVKVAQEIAIMPLGDEGYSLLSLCSKNEIENILILLDNKDGTGISFFLVFICGIIAIKYVTKISETVSAFGFTSVNTGAAVKALMVPVKVAGVAAGTAMAAVGTLRNRALPGASENEGNTVSGKYKGENSGEESGEKKPSLIEKLFDKASDGAINISAKAVEKGSDVAANGVEAVTDAAGNMVGGGVQAAGKGVGGALQQGGTWLSGTGVGAIVGVPMVAAGATVDASSQAAGEATKQAIKQAGKAAASMIRTAGKMAAKAVKTTGKIAKKAAKQAAKQIKKAAKQALKNTAKKLSPKELLKKGAQAARAKVERAIYGDEMADTVQSVRDAGAAKKAKYSKPPKIDK